jgi:large subunit ribosomal protein L24
VKFKVGDIVLVTTGKDKGKQGPILKVVPKENKVVVAGVNIYTKHIKPMAGRPGDRVRSERALPTGNIAILNDKKQPDRIGYRVAKDGSKERVFKKTNKVVPDNKAATTKTTSVAEKEAVTKKSKETKKNTK